MAKIYGLFGSMTGKLADTVMSVRNGEQIARKYQPVVFNPSSPSQVAQRAKMKLLSQLSAVMAPVIAFRRVGSLSKRNRFTAFNFPLTTFADNEADINLNQVSLTGGIAALPTLAGSISAGGELAIGLSLPVSSTTINRIVYAIFIKEADNKLRLADTAVVSNPGDDNRWGTTIDNVYTNSVVLAYGVRDNSEQAKTLFGNMTAPTAEEIAKVVTSSSLSESDITMTETRGITLTPAS